MNDEALEIVGAALEYAERGWHVFPVYGPGAGGRCACRKKSCDSVAKHPLVRKWPQEATTNTDRIIDWWERFPTANVGIATGGSSRLVVLDVDASDALGGWSSKTLTAKTPRGFHLYFQMNGTPARNSVGKIGPKLDVRGEGGYVVAPPSIHATRGHYSWVNPGAPLEIVPHWLLTSDQVPNGQRNDTLFKIAAAMQGRGESNEAILDELLHVNQKRCAPPLSHIEVCKIRDSVTRYQGRIVVPSQEEIAAVSTEQAIAFPLSSTSFFERNTKPRKEIIEGIIREQQLGAFAGPYGAGKSPTLADIAMHALNGVPWCGRAVEKRPVIHFDLETPAPNYKANLQAISARLGLPMPRVPEDLDVYLEHDSPDELGTKKLLAVLQLDFDARRTLIDEALNDKQNALVLIDPLELLFRIDTGKKREVLALYTDLRQLLSKYPRAAMLVTFNLRKWGRDGKRPRLLTNPREWLEEVCGTLDILNRSDVRLGLDFHDEDVRVLNGVRRAEDMCPLLIRSVAHNDQLAGFELCPPDHSGLSAAFTPKQLEHWGKLPAKFRFEQIADQIVPRASLKRLLDRAKSLGIVESNNGFWLKRGDR